MSQNHKKVGQKSGEVVNSLYHGYRCLNCGEVSSRFINPYTHLEMCYGTKEVLYEVYCKACHKQNTGIDKNTLFSWLKS